MDKLSLIDREALKRDLIDNRSFYPAIVKAAIENAPIIDAVLVVRCKDCKHARISDDAFEFDNTPLCECGYSKMPNRWHEYCSWGEQK